MSTRNVVALAEPRTERERPDFVEAAVRNPEGHVVVVGNGHRGRVGTDSRVDDRVRILAALPQCLRDRRKRRRNPLGERLPRLARPQPFRILERPLELVPRRRVGEVIQVKAVGPAVTVRPVGADAETAAYRRRSATAGSPGPGRTAGVDRTRRRGRPACPCTPRRSDSASMRITAPSRSAIYALMAESRFPKPIRIGTRAVRWVEQEVLHFIASRPVTLLTRGERPRPMNTACRYPRCCGRPWRRRRRGPCRR